MASITDSRGFPALFIAALVVLSGCAAGGRGDALAPQFVVDPRAPEVVWTYRSGRGIEVSPASTDRQIFVATTDRRIHLLDAGTGQRKWRKRIDAPLAGMPSIHAGSLYAATGRPDGAVYTLDLNTHRLRWRTPVGDAAGGAFFFHDSVLVVTRDGQVFALSSKDGKNLWAAHLETRVWGTSAFDSTRALLLIPGRNGKFFGVDAKNGEKRWVAELGKPLAGAASGDDGAAVVSIRGDLAYVDAATGAVRWNTPTRTSVSAAPIVAGDLVILAALDGSVTAFRTVNGLPAWKKNLGGPFRTSPAVRGEQIALAAVSGQVWVLDRSTGQIIGTTRHPETLIVSPVPTSTGWVVAGERGLVIAYRWEEKNS